MPRVDFTRARGLLVDHYHAHLDRCEQCRLNPFEMCAAGQLLAGAALEEVTKTSRGDAVLRLADHFLRQVGEDRIAEVKGDADV